jgi:cell division protein FtsL
MFKDFVAAIIVLVIAVVALVISHKVTLSQIETELKTLEAKAQAGVSVAVSDVKSFIAAVRAKF